METLEDALVVDDMALVLRVTVTIRASRVRSYGIVVTTVITSELIGGVD